MISHLIGGLQAMISSGTTDGELASHLEGTSAIMESHLRFEEPRTLIRSLVATRSIIPTGRAS